MAEGAEFAFVDVMPGETVDDLVKAYQPKGKTFRGEETDRVVAALSTVGVEVTPLDVVFAGVFLQHLSGEGTGNGCRFIIEKERAEDRVRLPDALPDDVRIKTGFGARAFVDISSPAELPQTYIRSLVEGFETKRQKVAGVYHVYGGLPPRGLGLDYLADGYRFLAKGNMDQLSRIVLMAPSCHAYFANNALPTKS